MHYVLGMVSAICPDTSRATANSSATSVSMNIAGSTVAGVLAEPTRKLSTCPYVDSDTIAINPLAAINSLWWAIPARTRFPRNLRLGPAWSTRKFEAADVSLVLPARHVNPILGFVISHR